MEIIVVLKNRRLPIESPSPRVFRGERETRSAGEGRNHNQRAWKTPSSAFGTFSPAGEKDSRLLDGASLEIWASYFAIRLRASVAHGDFASMAR